MIKVLVNSLFLHTCFSEQNLNKDNAVFKVKKLISNFKCDFHLLFEDDFKTNGRPKEYYLVELLGFK